MPGDLLLLIVLAFGLFCNKVIAVAEDLYCEITYKDWRVRESFKINWTLPSTVSESRDSEATVTWYDDLSLGYCDKTTLTSCTWYYGNGKSFDFTFTLNVSITDKERGSLQFNKTWEIDPDDCRLPPPVSEVIAEVINSTCIDLIWFYDSNTKCTDIYAKLYRISIWTNKKQLSDYKEVFPNGKHETTLCNGTYLVCDLQPFTKYYFAIQCQMADFYNYNNPFRGHFSKILETNAQTLSAVPAGIPAMTDGGFSYMVNTCDNDNTRTVEIYWKDIPENLKNGIITTFSLHIIPQDSSGQSTYIIQVNGDVFRHIIPLLCDARYTLRIHGSTDTGPSVLYSQMSVPSFDQNQITIQEVIPVFDNSTFYVWWTLSDSKAPSPPQFKIVWCIQDSENECSRAINWMPVHESTGTSPVVLPLQQEYMVPHRYRIGVSTPVGGIVWSKCFYLNAQDLQPPNLFAVKEDSSLPDGSLLVQWDNAPCESRSPGPYVQHFELYYCKVQHENDNNCIDQFSKVNVDRSRSVHTLLGLDPAGWYMLYLTSVGTGKTSQPSQRVYGQSMHHSNLWNSTLVTLVVIAVIVSIVVCAVLVNCSQNKVSETLRRLKLGAAIRIPQNPGYVGCERERLQPDRDSISRSSLEFGSYLRVNINEQGMIWTSDKTHDMTNI